LVEIFLFDLSPDIRKLNAMISKRGGYSMVKRYVILCLLVSLFVAGDWYKVKAAAQPLINGTWTGDLMTVKLYDDSYFQLSGALVPSPSDTLNIPIPDGGGGTTTEAASFTLDSNERLLKGSLFTGLTFTITTSKTGITGTLTESSGPIGTIGTIDGVVITANRFFLMNVTLTTPGSCVGQFQGTASIVPSNTNRLIFTASGVDIDCKQQIVTGKMTKQ
jgi:hypothetical protein